MATDTLAGTGGRRAGPVAEDDDCAVAYDEIADAGRCEAAAGAFEGVGEVPVAGAG